MVTLALWYYVAHHRQVVVAKGLPGSCQEGAPNSCRAAVHGGRQHACSKVACRGPAASVLHCQAQAFG